MICFLNLNSRENQIFFFLKMKECEEQTLIDIRLTFGQFCVAVKWLIECLICVFTVCKRGFDFLVV